MLLERRYQNEKLASVLKVIFLDEQASLIFSNNLLMGLTSLTAGKNVVFCMTVAITFSFYRDLFDIPRSLDHDWMALYVVSVVPRAILA